jgi:hypothetical protein
MLAQARLLTYENEMFAPCSPQHANFKTRSEKLSLLVRRDSAESAILLSYEVVWENPVRSQLRVKESLAEKLEALRRLCV